ncbi:MAG: hypothetical protein J6K58_03330 [Lachnospiraceae bacterium]|nr:hypothetical protein [Lachnospiraceae bacterium]
MDKYEYRVRAEEINALIEKREYAEAVKIADTIDWRRVKSVTMLCKVSELYKMNRRYEDSKEILLLAYDRQPGSRKIVYSLCELCIKLEELVQAIEYYKEFVQIAPRDTGRFILQYRLYEAQDVSLEERIAVLEEYKKRDYREKWAYELAYLYHRIGLATRCVEECDELILWFGEGKYVIKAMELKMLHVPLTPTQQEKYDKRFQTSANAYVVNTTETEQPQKEEKAGESSDAKEQGQTVTTDTIPSMPIQIKSVEVSNAPTMRIPSKDVNEEVEAAEDQDGQAADAESVTIDMPEIPLAETPDDLDIHVKTLDMGEYNTINLQKELAKNLAKIMEQEDMEATDATKALPIDSINDLAQQEAVEEEQPEEAVKEDMPKSSMDLAVTKEVVSQVVKALGTEEQEPITEEDLLNSLSGQNEPEILPEEEITSEETSEEEEPVEEIQQAGVEVTEIEEAVRDEEITEEETAEEEIVEETAIEENIIEENAVEEEAQEVSPEPAVEELSAAEAVEEEMVDEQITGQLSFEDIMAEWEETKKANEAKHLEEMRRKVLEQTGPMFKDFDAAAKASVQADLDLIAPTLDVFPGQTDLEEEPAIAELPEDDLTEESAEGFEEELPLHEEFAVEPEEESVVENSDEAEELEDIEDIGETSVEPVPEEVTEVPAAESQEPEFNPTIFNTAEINGLEEKLVSSLFEEEENAQEEFVDEVEELEEIEDISAVEIQQPEQSFEENPVAEEVQKPGSHTEEFDKSLEKLVLEALADTEKREINVPKGDTGFIITDLTEVEKETPQVQIPVEKEPVSQAKPIPVRRTLTRDEKEMFGSIAQTKQVQEEVANAIDNISLNPCIGNVLVTGEKGTGTLTVAKNLIKVLSVNDDAFSGKVAKITGELLNNKSIDETLNSLDNGALIVEQAGRLDDMALLALSEYLKKKKDNGILIILEDTKKELDNLLTKGNMPKQFFDLRIDIAALDNDGLVNYGKEYANEQEYSIDDMGVLALYTRISEMQTNEHAVTVDEVKELVDEAIRNAEKKNISHFMDVLFAKRYDDEDMIVLREKDFLK